MLDFFVLLVSYKMFNGDQDQCKIVLPFLVQNCTKKAKQFYTDL